MGNRDEFIYKLAKTEDDLLLSYGEAMCIDDTDRKVY